MIGQLNAVKDIKQGIEELKVTGMKHKGEGIAPFMIKHLNKIKDVRTRKCDLESAAEATKAIEVIETAK